ncbi:MAG: hypothetical protein SLAVMIC_00919 [uncultured marine phage]|uniref:Uncharacterized protein n=1 Tax=uncultured marine phage TaxID=707152 RepID=A0A8D9CAV5_9VIRU|nr:MAG: hypothetical protein SLAVMIC_00919 [uncultured marine phage]
MSLKFKSAFKGIKGYKNSKLAKSETNDCVVRGFASAFDTTYNKAHKLVKELFRRKDGKGTNTWTLHSESDKLSDNKTILFGKKMSKVEFEPVTVESSICTQVETWYQEGRSTIVRKTLTLYSKRGSKYSRMTVGNFIKMFPKGSFILSVRGHVFALKNGVVVGNYQDSKKMRVIVEKAWQVR